MNVSSLSKLLSIFLLLTLLLGGWGGFAWCFTGSGVVGFGSDTVPSALEEDLSNTETLSQSRSARTCLKIPPALPSNVGSAALSPSGAPYTPVIPSAVPRVSVAPDSPTEPPQSVWRPDRIAPQLTHLRTVILLN